MENIHPENITTDRLSIPVFTERDLQVDMLRLDKLHPVISGNKWFKLRYYLEQAKTTGIRTLLTFGGAWSNHLHATAAACYLNGLQAIGIIRGEKPAVLSTTLQDAGNWGMQLIFTDRASYREKKIPECIDQASLLIAGEGGYGPAGAAGAATLLDYCNTTAYTHILCATGTGTMLAGIMNRCAPHIHCTGISVMKNNFSLPEATRLLLQDKSRLPSILHDFHEGGYARHTPALLAFMNDFYTQTGIPTDFVYTGKLVKAVHELALKNHFPAGSKILLIHSGGLQGNSSLSKGTLIF